MLIINKQYISTHHTLSSLFERANKANEMQRRVRSHWLNRDCRHCDEISPSRLSHDRHTFACKYMHIGAWWPLERVRVFSFRFRSALGHRRRPHTLYRWSNELHSAVWATQSVGRSFCALFLGQCVSWALARTQHSGALSLCSPFFRIKLCVVLEWATAEKQNKLSRRLLPNKYFERGC